MTGGWGEKVDLFCSLKVPAAILPRPSDPYINGTLGKQLAFQA